MRLKTFKEAINYLNKTIPSSFAKKFPAEIGIKRTRSLLKKLGDPQNKLKVIHIAGTSGKGSTATITAKILEAHGQKTGLTLSPHVSDIRERFQVGEKLISKERFVESFNEMIPHMEKTNEEFDGKVTYFEALQVLAFYLFEKEKVDVAVIETGMGGTYDATNVVDSEEKICVITRIGIDHTNILGNTLEEIAEQKAGIIQKNNLAIVLSQSKKINEIFKKRSSFVSADLSLVEGNNMLAGRLVETEGMAEYQKENLSLSIEATKEFLKREGKVFSNEKMRTALKDFRFKGRFDVVRLRRKDIIIDGAHNLQKMTAFLSSLEKKYKDEKFTFLIGFKKDKDFLGMLKKITPLAKEIIVTEFFSKKRDMPILAQDAKKMVREAGSLDVKIRAVKDSREAFKKALEKDQNIVVTGSLYLVSEVYEYLGK